MRAFVALAVLSLSLLGASVSSAEQQRIVQSTRIVVADVVPDAPADIGSLDLGPAPPPGGSRVVTPDDVRRALQRGQADEKAVVLREPVRVVAAHQTIQPKELAELVKPVIESTLPRGVSLVAVSPSMAITTRPGVQVGKCKLPTLPRRAGQNRTTVMVELLQGKQVTRRVPIPITVEISPEAARPDVARGTTVRVFIESGAVVVSTRGEVLTDANVGDTVRVALASTRRIVQARLISERKAQVIAP